MPKTIVEQLDDAIAVLQDAKDHGTKVDKGNKAAGVRLRAGIAQVAPIIKNIKLQSLGKAAK